MYSPSWAAVTAATGSILMSVTSFAFSLIKLTISTLSTTGLVSGITHTVVNPPLAAALAPVLIVSLYSYPGSLKCTCRSISPGITKHPAASIILSASSLISLSTLRIIPSSNKISLTSSVLLAGSITRPFLISVFIIISIPASI